MFHDGLSFSSMSACVKMVSPGSRLTLPAPLRMAPSCTAEMPLRLLRIDPASLRLSESMNLRGGAKSRPVKVLDLRREWLWLVVSIAQVQSLFRIWVRKDSRARKSRHLLKGVDERRVRLDARRLVRPSLTHRAL